MRVVPYSDEAYELLHQGAIALAEVERAGIRVDERYLRHAMKRVQRQVLECRRELQSSEVWAVWNRNYGSIANLGSDVQLVTVLFDELWLPAPERTATGRYRADAGTLRRLEHPFVKTLLRMRLLSKALSTHLKGLAQEVVDGYIHPVFSLHTVTTYR